MQPIKGRKVGGGIRFGEMERDSLLAHGAAYLLHDRLHSSSDYKPCYLCNACGSLLSPTWVPNVTPKGMEHMAGVGGAVGGRLLVCVCFDAQTLQYMVHATHCRCFWAMGVQLVSQWQVCGADRHPRGVSVFGSGAGSHEHQVVRVCRRPAHSSQGLIHYRSIVIQGHGRQVCREPSQQKVNIRSGNPDALGPCSNSGSRAGSLQQSRGDCTTVTRRTERAYASPCSRHDFAQNPLLQHSLLEAYPRPCARLPPTSHPTITPTHARDIRQRYPSVPCRHRP